MPDYENAIEKLKTKVAEESSKAEEAKPLEALATRAGYMGAGFLIAAQWTLEPRLYILGFICVMVQTASRKQWNLVALNLNGLIAWIKHFIV